MTAPAPDPDELLASELEQTLAAIAEARTENESLRRQIEPGAPASPPEPRLVARRDVEPAAAYRAEDRGVRLEREVEQANDALVSLRIDNAILQSRAAPLKTARAFPIRAVAVAIALALGGAFLWFLTENLGLLLFATVVAFVGWGATELIDRIRPDGSNPRTPPMLPPPGGGV